jgi:hypothetical protein
MSAIVKIQNPKSETETFHVQGTPMEVEFYPSSYDDDYEIESINRLPEDMFQAWVVGEIREQIRVHVYKGKINSLEYKGEQMSDESRGN